MTTTRFNPQYLANAGLGALSDDDQESLVGALIMELETRVGNRLAQRLTAAQLDEFDLLISGGSQEAADAWLQRMIPGYHEVVVEEAAGIDHELRVHVPKILRHRAPSSAPGPSA